MAIIKPDFEALIHDCFAHPENSEMLTHFNTAFRPHLLATLTPLTRSDPSLAEDACQTALIKFLELFRAGAQPDIDYVPYFIAIARNSLLDELRLKRRHLLVDDIFEELIQLPRPDERRRAEIKIALLQAMLQLKPRCKFALESYYLMEMPTEEVARRLKVKPRSLYTTLDRCRKELRKILQT